MTVLCSMKSTLLLPSLRLGKTHNLVILPLQILYYSTGPTHFVAQLSLQSIRQTPLLNVVHADIIIIPPVMMPFTSLPKCHFISMCVELRIRVYRYLFEDATALVRNVHDFKTCDLVGTRLWSTGCHKSILSTCRTIHVEAKPILAGSILLIMGDSWWPAANIFKVWYPQQLTSYLPHIRELRLDSADRACGVVLNTARLPNLESLTVVGLSRGSIVHVDIAHEVAAVSLLIGDGDQQLINDCLESEHHDQFFELDLASSHLLWFRELLRKPGRTFQIFRENDYDYRITKTEKSGRTGRLLRRVRLKFKADSGKLLKMVSATCGMHGQWDAETVELCASRNREAGITDPHELERDGSDLKYPV